MSGHEESIFNNKQILIVDPSDITRKELKLYFERKGAVVYTVGHVEKIASVIKGTTHSGAPVDLVIIDVRLPGCFGFFALKTLGEALAGRSIPVFVMSFGFSRLAIRQMVRWNVMGYIRKPFKIESLENFLVDRLNHFSQIIEENKEKNEAIEFLQNKKPNAA